MTAGGPAERFGETWYLGVVMGERLGSPWHLGQLFDRPRVRVVDRRREFCHTFLAFPPSDRVGSPKLLSRRETCGLEWNGDWLSSGPDFDALWYLPCLDKVRVWNFSLHFLGTKAREDHAVTGGTTCVKQLELVAGLDSAT